MKSKIAIILFMGAVMSSSCSSNKKIAAQDNSYKLEKIVYQINDAKTCNLLASQQKLTEFAKGENLSKTTFQKDRERITSLVRKELNPNFSEENIRYEIDTTLEGKKFSVLAIID